MVVELLGVLADGHEVRLTFSGPPRVKDAVSQQRTSSYMTARERERGALKYFVTRQYCRRQFVQGHTLGESSEPSGIQQSSGRPKWHAPKGGGLQARNTADSCLTLWSDEVYTSKLYCQELPGITLLLLSLIPSSPRR